MVIFLSAYGGFFFWGILDWDLNLDLIKPDLGVFTLWVEFVWLGVNAGQDV